MYKVLGYYALCSISWAQYRPHVNTLATASQTYLQKLLNEAPPKLKTIANDPSWGVQIIFTQINRDAQNRPILKHHTYHLQSDSYFYPASIVKLPVCALALEKLNHLKITGITKDTPLLTRGGPACVPPLTQDPTHPQNHVTLAHLIIKQLVYSDNEAFDRLYDFLGPQYITQTLHKKGYTSAWVGHRLRYVCSEKENTCLASWEYPSLYKQQAHCNETLSPSLYQNATFQITTYKDGKWQNLRRSADKLNALSLADAHEILIALIFPQDLPHKKRFNLTEKDYHFLRKYMSMYPTELRLPNYPNAPYYVTGRMKYFFLGGQDTTAPPHIRIFNKVGMAWGYLIDVAYIVDFKAQIEFFLSAAIRAPATPSGTLRTDEGLEFLRQLSLIIYEKEKKRRVPRKPDLSNFMYEYRF
ncbi:MAG: serine hydrolase [Bacteroidia bacterium]